LKFRRRQKKQLTDFSRHEKGVKKTIKKPTLSTPTLPPKKSPSNPQTPPKKQYGDCNSLIMGQIPYLNNQMLPSPGLSRG